MAASSFCSFLMDGIFNFWIFGPLFCRRLLLLCVEILRQISDFMFIPLIWKERSLWTQQRLWTAFYELSSVPFVFWCWHYCIYTFGQTGVRNLSWYLRMKPLRLPFKFVDVKLLVENHLNCAFYTYSVMSNYDYKVRTMLFLWQIRTIVWNLWSISSNTCLWLWCWVYSRYMQRCIN